uniref:Nucleotidyltransferase domain containing protein, putative n=1 Tax=Theileria annulata TaxID=5874 RepID=A0A3B0MX83_THEAN
MSISLCKRCLKLHNFSLSFLQYNQKLLDFSHNSYFPLFLRALSNISGSKNLKDTKTINLTYEKVSDPDFDDFDEDEPLYPEPFNEVQNISLSKLISFRNSLSQSEEPHSESGVEKSQIEDLKLRKVDVHDESPVKNGLNDSDLKSRNERISEFLEKILREKVNRKCSVSFFGSAINGLWTDGSDLDVCVQIPNVNSRSATIRNLRRISNVLTPLSPSRIFQNRFTAKIPILHWKRDYIKTPNTLYDSLNTQEKMYFECDDIPSIDISVNNDLAIINSILIGNYVSFEPRVRDLVLFLKLWARNRNINNRSEGTLSSFAISLMLIHFLQNCNPPLLPSLQDLAFSTNEEPKYISGVDCRFSTDFNKIKSELNYITKSKRNNSDNKTLLTQFFKYFGWYNLYAQNKPILIRSVDLSEFNTENSLINEPYLHVDNPFEVGVDVANIAIHQRTKITSEFRKAYHSLKSGNSLSTLLNNY